MTTGKTVHAAPTKRLSRPAVAIAFTSRKGGVGKTTITKEVSTALAAEGYSILTLEIDDNPRLTSLVTNRRQRTQGPVQEAQTTYALFTRPDEGVGVLEYHADVAGLLAKTFKRMEADVAAGRASSANLAELHRIVETRGWSRAVALDFLPGSESIRRVENEMRFMAQSQQAADWHPMLQLPRGLDKLRPHYDYIIMDTPPSLATIQTNVALAADYIVPIVDFDADSEDDYFRTREFIRTARGYARQLNRQQPVIPGVVYNKYDPTFQEVDVALLERYTKPHVDEEGALQEPIVKEPTLGVIPLDTRRVKTSQAARASVALYTPLSAIAEALYLTTQNLKTAIEGHQASLGGR